MSSQQPTAREGENSTRDIVCQRLAISVGFLNGAIDALVMPPAVYAVAVRIESVTRARTDENATTRFSSWGCFDAITRSNIFFSLMPCERASSERDFLICTQDRFKAGVAAGVSFNMKERKDNAPRKLSDGLFLICVGDFHAEARRNVDDLKVVHLKKG